MKNLIMWKKGMRSKVRYILKQLKGENSNFIQLFLGKSGSGKTWCGISEAYAMDNNFDVERQLVFTFRDLMKLINSEWFKGLKIKIVIFDEPQTDISNRNWQSAVNKMMNYVISTFRHQNIALFFCCPYPDFLDSASMKMVHCHTEMVSIDKKRKLVKTKPRLQQYNPSMKKTYQHPIYVLRNKKTQKMVFDFIPKPPQELIDKYELMKTRFTSKLNEDIERQLNELEGKKDKRPELTEKQETALNYMEQFGNAKKGAEMMNLTLNSFYVHLRAAQKKGFKPKIAQNNTTNTN